MWSWFKRQISDIKGNAKWDGIKWAACFIREWWVPMLTTFAAISFWFSHLSIPSRILIMVPLAGWFVQGVISIIKATRLRSQINITFTTDDGFSHQQCIKVKNHGEDRVFTAECQIESTNRPPNHPKGRFRLGWGDGTSPEIVIPQHLSGRLLIANFEEERAHTQWRMTVWKLAGEKSVGQWWAAWLYDDANDLPRFELIVTLTAQGAKEPWIRRFVLTPKTRLGPLSLQEAT